MKNHHVHCKSSTSGPFSMTFFCSDLTIEASILVVPRPKAAVWRYRSLLPSINRGLRWEVSRLDPWPTFLDQRVDLGLCGLGLDWASHGLFGRHWKTEVASTCLRILVDVRNLCQISMILDEIWWNISLKYLHVFASVCLIACSFGYKSLPPIQHLPGHFAQGLKHGLTTWLHIGMFGDHECLRLPGTGWNLLEFKTWAIKCPHWTSPNH